MQKTRHELEARLHAAVLRFGPVRPKDLAQSLNAREGLIRTLLKRLWTTGRIERCKGEPTRYARKGGCPNER